VAAGFKREGSSGQIGLEPEYIEQCQKTEPRGESLKGEGGCYDL